MMRLVPALVVALVSLLVSCPAAFRVTLRTRHSPCPKPPPNSQAHLINRKG